MKVSDKDKGFKAAVAAIAEAGDYRAVAGFMDGEIAEVMAYQEYGTSTIPARPFMRSTADENAQKYADLLTEKVRKVMAEGSGTIEGAFLEVALVMHNDLKEAMTKWNTPPNADYTIQKKGFDNPLIETGVSRNAVQAEVRTKADTPKVKGE